MYEACATINIESFRSIIMEDPSIVDQSIGLNGENVFELASSKFAIGLLNEIIAICKEKKFTIKSKITTCVQDSALHLAAVVNDLNLVKELLEFFEPSIRKPRSGATPLHLAACCESVEVLEYLLGECHQDPLVRDNFGQTPLHFAASVEAESIIEEKNALKILELLIKASSSNDYINIKDLNGHTALHCAVVKKNTLAEKFLLSKDAMLLKKHFKKRSKKKRMLIMMEKDADSSLKQKNPSTCTQYCTIS